MWLNKYLSLTRTLSTKTTKKSTQQLFRGSSKRNSRAQNKVEIRPYEHDKDHNDTNPVRKGESRRRTFIDSVRIHVRGGAGGQGLKKYGGCGGNGGNVFVKAVSGLNLKQFKDKYQKRRFVASHGCDSSKHAVLGLHGEDLYLEVPEGIVAKDASGTEIGSVNLEGESVCVALGGNGGNSDNNYFGRKGEARTVVLDLKLLADIGLVGFPNAGKSTFLSSISNSKTKIGDYPFTTLRPHLGTLEFPDFREITIADLPGLIEGAHLNLGMGHKFLKHIERTKLLLFVVDVMGFQLHLRYHERTAFETVLLLNRELEIYNPSLLDKPAALAINKIDLDKDGEETKKLINLVKRLPDSLAEVEPEFRPKKLIKFDGVYMMSAKNKESLNKMKIKLRQKLDYHAELERKAQMLDQPSLDFELLQEHSKFSLL